MQFLESVPRCATCLAVWQCHESRAVHTKRDQNSERLPCDSSSRDSCLLRVSLLEVWSVSLGCSARPAEALTSVLPAEVPGCQYDQTSTSNALLAQLQSSERGSQTDNAACRILDAAETLRRERAFLEVEELNKTLVTTRASMQGLVSELNKAVSVSEGSLVEAHVDLQVARGEIEKLKKARSLSRNKLSAAEMALRQQQAHFLHLRLL